ncbi:MAG: zinc metallopeptidase [Candidatus Brocadiia bacterium]
MFLYPFDPFILLLVPPLILAYYARSKVKSTFEEFSHRISSSGITGAEAARRILRRNGLEEVEIEQVEGHLSDHYDPREKVLRLSTGVHDSNSLAALGVAAHETGHALQDKRGYLPLKIRKGIFPLAAFGNNLGPIIFIVGLGMLFFTQGRGQIPQLVAQAGILLFSAGAFFTIVTLPVEFNASKRALRVLVQQNIISPSEREDARKVLRAAALTYVAAAFMAVMMLVRFILIFLAVRDE